MNKFATKKSLGQNFLRSEEIIKHTVDASDIKKTDSVLEIGPGEGILTNELLSRASKVIAIEKDSRLIPILSKKFEKEIKASKLELIEGDILTLNLEEVLKNEAEYKVIANIPYYITGQIFRRFLEAERKPSSMTLMLQKEVAERVVAQDEKESILSISIKAYGTPKYEFIVQKEEFSPVPKVDSAVLTIKNISDKFFESDHALEKRFFSIVKQGFASKRRKITNNIKQSFKNEGEMLEKLKMCKIDKNSRAENLAPKDWMCLIKN